MANIEIQLRLNDIDITKVKIIWQKLKDLQINEPQLEISNFSFRE